MLRLPPIDPAETYPVYEYILTLGDAVYTLTITYRERTDGWYLDVDDADGERLLSGKRLAADWPATARYRIDGLFAGDIALLDVEDGDVELGEDDLGGRGELVYIEADDWPASATSEDVTVS